MIKNQRCAADNVHLLAPVIDDADCRSPVDLGAESVAGYDFSASSPVEGDVLAI